MSSPEQLEAIAEAIVFAHDPEVALLESGEGNTEITALERTAALATAAMAVAEPVPEGLQQRLAASALAFCAERKSGSVAGHSLRPLPNQLPHQLPNQSTTPNAPRGRAFGMFLLGVAATGLVWLGVNYERFSAKAPPTATEILTAMRSDPNARELGWKAGPSPLSGDVTGSVIWEDDEQTGYMTFTGLPTLDSEHEFQLWIVDGTRTGAPVDGGLFTIDSANGETIVPITARLPIGKAAGFVITVEPKGGVVVSDQEHVVAVAGL